ncbi:MAG TPA: tetratricopeptide repeat protein [Bryobacteraceae bacterium]|nr:tetratricopeptide repeat protein [Bryobacteraceae bacterium]
MKARAQLAGWMAMAAIAIAQSGPPADASRSGPPLLVPPGREGIAPERPLSTLQQSIVMKLPSNHTSTKWNARVLPEGTTSLPSIPLVIPRFEGKMLWQCRVEHVFGDGNIVYRIEPGDVLSPPDTSAGIPDDCRVTIRLEGYQTAEVTLHHKAQVTLKRIGAAREGSTVSAQSLSVPDEARKAWEKGVEEVNKEKWDKARKDLERAVAVFPRYAAAWTDLGEVYRRQSMEKDAHEAFDHALDADPRYVRAYVPSARMALDEGRFEDGLQLSEKAIELNPVEFPEAWFYKAVANYNLKRFDAAESSVLKAEELDSQHALLPRAEHLLGFVLTEKHEYAKALVHLRNYVRISPMATDVPETIQLIATLEHAETAE